MDCHVNVKPRTIELLSLTNITGNEAVITCEVAGFKVEILIDSGSSVNTITETTFRSMLASDLHRNHIFNIKHKSEKSLMAYAAEAPLSVIASFVANLWISNERLSAFEKFYVIKNAKRSLLSRDTAIRYDVLILGLSVSPAAQIQSITSGGTFPKFEISPVRLNIDHSIQGRRLTYTNIEHGWKEIARKRIQEMLNADIIEEVTPDMEFTHCSAMLAVPKGKNDFRLVVDLRGPNRCIIREPHKMPTMDTILAQLAGSVRFSTIDLSNAFFHIELDANSRHITNFYSGDGFYRYKRLPFGLCNAPDIFQMTMEAILKDCEGVLIYLDDILVHGKSKVQHDNNLKKVLGQLKSHNVKLNQDKCNIDTKSCVFLGFRIDKHGCHVTDDRIEAIRAFRNPQNLAEIRSFIGLMNFVDKFIVNRADKVQHLQRMIRDKKFEWTQEAEEEFNFMKKEALSAITTLAFYDPSDDIELYVDASFVGLGAILVQRDKKNKPRIVACASKALSRTETRYPQTQLEALAVVWGTERFRFYLTGRDFTIWTDGEANEYLFNDAHRLGKRAITRAESWALRLQPYSFSIKRVPGDENIADVFSRLIKESQEVEPFDDTAIDHVLFSIDVTLGSLTYEDIATASEEDETITQLRLCLKSGEWPDDMDGKLRKFYAVRSSLVSIGDVMVYRDKYVIPTGLRELVLRAAHRGHVGMSSMKRSIRRSMWWPGVNEDIEGKASDCMVCKTISPAPRPIPLSSRTLPDEPMEVLQIDFLYIPRCGTEEFLMVTDTFSRMFWTIEMRRTDAKSTTNALRDIFNIWGRPRVMITDNGPPFNSEGFSESWKSAGVEHRKVIPYCPQMNGMIERRNQGVLKALRAAAVEQVPWRQAMAQYVNAYNHDIPHSVTNATPFEILTGRRYKGFFPSMIGLTHDPLTRDDIAERDANAKDKSVQYANKRRGARDSAIKEGDWVLIANKHRKDKMDVTFSKDRYQVICREGAKAIVRNRYGVEYTRWVSDVKLVPPQDRFKELPTTHVFDPEFSGEEISSKGIEAESTNQNHHEDQQKQSSPETELRKSSRIRLPPVRFGDYVAHAIDSIDAEISHDDYNNGRVFNVLD